jgi:hypothetical protein
MRNRELPASLLIEQISRSIRKNEARIQELTEENEELRTTARVLRKLLGLDPESADSVSSSQSEPTIVPEVASVRGEGKTPEQRDSGAESQPRTTLALHPLLRRPKRGISEAAADIIRAAAVPLHQGEIAERLLASGYEYSGPPGRLPDTVGKVLSRRASKGRLVAKVAPGTFALREWVTRGSDYNESNLFESESGFGGGTVGSRF